MKVFHHQISRKSGKVLMQATVAYDYDIESGDLTWSAAFCNTKEDSFVRAEGEKIAKERVGNGLAIQSKVRPYLKPDEVRLHIKRKLSNYRRQLIHEA